MGDDPYKAPEAIPQPSTPTKPSHSSKLFDRLWIMIGAVGFIPVISAFFYHHTYGKRVVVLAAGVSLVSLCLAGIKWSWGPVIPCTMIGGITLFLVATPTLSTIFDYPLTISVGMFVGGVVGCIPEEQSKGAVRKDSQKSDTSE